MIEQFVLTCDAIGPVTVVRAHGREVMNELPEWTVEVLSSDASIDLAAPIGASASIAFADDDGGERTISFIVTQIAHAGVARDGRRYELSLSTGPFLLTLRSGYRIFQEQTTQQIVEHMLQDAGVQASEMSFRLSGQYGVRTYCVQYGETEWAFVLRLLADEGINVWFDAASDAGPLIVFGDGASSHDSIAGAMTLRFEDGSGMSRSASSLHALRRAYSITHDRVHVRDYDVRHPDVLVEGVAGDGPLEHYEYPANVVNTDAAAARAKVRLEQLSRFAVQVTAESACARLSPGRIVRIEGASDDLLNGEHLIVEVQHQITQASQNATEGRPYSNRVVMVPHAGERAFRPDLPRDVPKVDLLETAVVTGPKGQEIHVDDLGCIKIRFHWDRAGIDDDRSSRWVRSLQMAMQGSMLLPRVGWEVPVVYIDGNPDQPFVLGRLYNGGAAAPYGLPGKKATSTFQSATSPSDGSTQEIRLSDDAGSMEAYVHATKDQTVTVGGTYTKSVAVDKIHDVGMSKSVTVHGSQTTSVGGTQTVTVGADASIVVKGMRVEVIGGMESIGVTGTYMLVSNGSYSETIGGLYGLECNASNSTIQGPFTQAIAGPMVLTAGLGTNNSVAGGRRESVGGARSFSGLASYADSTQGTKTISSGNATDDAKTKHITNAATGSISVGGGATISSGGPIKIEAASIALNIGGTLTAKGGGTLEIGGTIDTTGKVHFDASKTAKTSTSKVG